jgi:hypothetical protein
MRLKLGHNVVQPTFSEMEASMKKMLGSILLLVSVFMCSADQQTSQQTTTPRRAANKANAPASRTRLYVITENKEFGYMDSTGRVILPPRYGAAGEFSEGRGKVYFTNEKYGFVDAEGKVVIQPQFDGAGDFHEGLARVTVGNKSGFVDESGKLVIPLWIGEGPRAIPWEWQISPTDWHGLPFSANSRAGISTRGVYM